MKKDCENESILKSKGNWNTKTKSKMKNEKVIKTNTKIAKIFQKLKLKLRYIISV